MDSNKCPGVKDAQLLEMLLQPPEPLNLTNLNNDCKEHIFDYLDWSDMINIAETSKQLNTAVCQAFKRKYKNAKIDIGLCLMNSFEELRILYPDVLVTCRLMALKLLRNFGHLIVNLHIDFFMFELPSHFPIIIDYLTQYGSKSFIQLSLQNSCHRIILSYKQKPFINVKTLHIEQCYFDNELHINQIFPNLQTLKLGTNHYRNSSAIKFHVPMVKHLAFTDKIHNNVYKWKFEGSDIEELLKLNTQLEELVLHLHGRYDSKIRLGLPENFPNLRRLELFEANDILSVNMSKTIHLDHITHFTQMPSYVSTRFSLTKLKHLKFKKFEIDWNPIQANAALDFINKNKDLTSITFACCSIKNIPQFFKLKNVLTNIEELRIDISDKLHIIPPDCILQFLKQNRALRTFSLKGDPSGFSYLSDAIISNETDLRIRNRALEFTINRSTDISPIKYVLRHMTRRVIDGARETKQFMECCTYEESQLTPEHDNEVYIKTVSEMAIRITYGKDSPQLAHYQKYGKSK